MAFSNLKSDLSGRVRPQYENFAAVFGRIENTNGREILFGIRIPDGEPVKVALSQSRGWRDRRSLGEQFSGVEPGSALILYESEKTGDIHEIRHVENMSVHKDEPVRIVHNHYARVGEPVRHENGWSQPVQVLHTDEAVICTTKADATAAILSAFERGDVGGQGFALRGIDEEGVAIAVRFQRLWDDAANEYTSPVESYNFFLDANMMIQGLSEKASGWQILEYIESTPGATWEVIPLTSINMRGEIVQAAAEGSGRNRAAPYRYDLTSPATGTGYVPSLVSLTLGNRFYCREALPVTGGIAPVSLPYVPTRNFQPVYRPAAPVKGPEYIPLPMQPKPANEIASDLASPPAPKSGRGRNRKQGAVPVEPVNESPLVIEPSTPDQIDTEGPEYEEPIEAPDENEMTAAMDEEISIENFDHELDAVDLSGLADLDLEPVSQNM